MTPNVHKVSEIIKRNIGRILLWSLPVVYAWGVFFNHRDPIQMLIDSGLFIVYWYIGRLLGALLVYVFFKVRGEI